MWFKFQLWRLWKALGGKGAAAYYNGRWWRFTGLGPTEQPRHSPPDGARVFIAAPKWQDVVWGVGLWSDED